MGAKKPIARIVEDVSKGRSDCLRLLAHDVGNPITAIRILAEVLRDDIEDPDARRDIRDVLEAADLAAAIMEGMSTMLRLDGEPEEFTWFPLDVVQILQEVIDRPALRRRVKLELPQELQMAGDQRALGRAFTDLLVNACRLVTAPDEVVVRAQAIDGIQHIVVRHPGDGIPENLRPLLLQRHGAVELRRNHIPVAATGLSYTDYVMGRHGGRVDIRTGDDGVMEVVCALGR